MTAATATFPTPAEAERNARSEDVECPKCGSTESTCLTPKGRAAKSIHSERIDAAKAEARRKASKPIDCSVCGEGIEFWMANEGKTEHPRCVFTPRICSECQEAAGRWYTGPETQGRDVCENCAISLGYAVYTESAAGLDIGKTGAAAVRYAGREADTGGCHCQPSNGPDCPNCN